MLGGEPVRLLVGERHRYLDVGGLACLAQLPAVFEIGD